MKLNQENYPKMNSEQKARYYRHLDHVKTRNLFLRKVKSGELPKNMTFKKYRKVADVKKGFDLKPETDVTKIISSIESLVQELKRTEERRAELLAHFQNIVPIAS